MLQKVNVHIQPDGETLEIDWIQHIVRTVLKAESTALTTGINIIFVDDQFIQELNATYLGKDRPTDVIAFLLEEDIFGEVYVSLDTARSQADIYDVPFYEEIARLVVHGVLHLLGYDDGSDEEKIQMTNKEDGYLDKMSYPD